MNAVLLSITLAVMVAVPVMDAVRGAWTVFLVLDDKDTSRGVEAQIARRAMTPPSFDASHVDGYPLKVLKVQGFDKRAPAWRIGYGDHWEPVLHWCPCCMLWEELGYRVAVHRERLRPMRRRVNVSHKRFGEWIEHEPQWPAVPTRKVLIRDFVALRVWR